jgi:hypothetical protein
MNKINKINKIIILLVFTLLIFQLGFINSEDIGAEVDVSEIMGLKDVKIIGQGIEVEKLVEDEENFYRISFINEGAFLVIEKNKFENILSQEKAKHPTYIKIDKQGGILNADFTVNENGGNYTFEENTIEAPPNSRVML